MSCTWREGSSEPFTRAGPAAQFECHGQQSIPGQNGHRFAIDLVIGRFPPAEIIVVHGRQIIVDERIGMNQFQ